MPPAEKAAMRQAVEYLDIQGESLGAPYSSAVRGAPHLRELRPRAGRSPWRAFYRRVSDFMLIGAVGPEALHDRRGFDRAVRTAAERIAAYDRGG